MKPLKTLLRYLSMILIGLKSMIFSRCKFIPLFMGLFFSCEIALAQNELPPSLANLKSVKAGSLIIPMDTVMQRKPGFFNLKAYGLVNALLQNEIPVMWAIRAGKGRTTLANTTDFTVSTNRVFPDTTAISSIAFRNGPFIIDSAWVATALPIITAYANNVVIYKLNTTTSIDIRYTLTFKPFLGLLNGSPQSYDTITVHVLQEAGFTSSSYKLQSSNQVFSPASGYTLLSDAHYIPGDTTHINPVLRFVNQYGGNLIANCAAIGAFENTARIMTTAGIDSFSTGIATTGYFFPDQAIAQFLGNLITPVGEYKFWNVKTGSLFDSTRAYKVVRGTAGAQHYIVAGAKLRANSEKGSNVFYLPGHEYYFYGNGNANDNNKINGRRIFLNAVFIPPNDSTKRDFITDVQFKMVTQPGLPVKNEPFTIYLIAKNVGQWRARNIKIQAALPPGLTYLSHFCGAGSYNSGTGVWSLDSIAKNVTDTLHLTVTISQLGNIIYPGILINPSLEYVKTNNLDTVKLFGVSRPDAVRDSMSFFSSLFQDAPTKANDTDEDGDLFGNTQIVAGPYHGTAQVINGDTIRYTLGAGYAGLDSLRYVTCDQYPLCDSAWLVINIPFPLPVTLLRFDGKRSGDKVNLHWITLSEEGNDYFNIERGIDNNSFELRGRVNGAGNSNTLKEYNFNDVDNSDPIYYYRLRQFDFNGQSHLSPVIALSRKQENKVSFKLIPNPVGKSEQLLALINGLQTGFAEFRIADISGRVIVSKTLNIAESNQLELITISYAIETGCYMVTLITQYETVSTRLIVN